jgi:L-fuconolactonase
VVGWFDLTEPGLDERIAEARERPGGERLVGVRHQLQVEPDPCWLARADVRRGLATVARHGLAYDVVVSPEQLGLVAATVAALPDVGFVLDHAGKPPIASGRLDDWLADLGVLARADNLTVKLSGLVTEADWARWRPADLRPVSDAVLERFGTGRVMAGSDWPVCLLAGADYDRVTTVTDLLLAALSADERARVLGETAVAAYGLRLG